MKFAEKYTPEAEKLLEENKAKIVLSDDAFAICQFLDLIGRALRGR